MITIIHGDDTASSRNFFLEQKQKTPAKVSFAADDLILTDLIQAVGSGGLFGETKHVFIEDFISRKKNKEDEEILSYLLSQKSSHATFWEGKELSKKILSEFKNATIKSFTIPKEIFVFLDSIKPNNTTAIQILHRLLSHADVEFIFFMLIRQFRLLVASTDTTSPNIDEFNRLLPWQKSKILRQARLFSVDKLTRIYKHLALIDYQQKTGVLSIPLVTTLDLLLIDL